MTNRYTWCETDCARLGPARRPAMGVREQEVMGLPSPLSPMEAQQLFQTPRISHPSQLRARRRPGANGCWGCISEIWGLVLPPRLCFHFPPRHPDVLCRPPRRLLSDRLREHHRVILYPSQSHLPSGQFFEARSAGGYREVLRLLRQDATRVYCSLGVGFYRGIHQVWGVFMCGGRLSSPDLWERPRSCCW